MMIIYKQDLIIFINSKVINYIINYKIIKFFEILKMSSENP